MANNANNLAQAALSQAGITRGNPNDARGVVGRVAGGRGRGGRDAMDVDGGGGGRVPTQGRQGRKHTSSTPYGTSTRPLRPGLNPSQPASRPLPSIADTDPSDLPAFMRAKQNPVASSSASAGQVNGGGGGGGRSSSVPPVRREREPPAAGGAGGGGGSNRGGQERTAGGKGAGRGAERNRRDAGGDGGDRIRFLKDWVKSRKRGEGLIDLSAMSNDPVLLDSGVKPPGHPKAMDQMGDVLWKVVMEDDPRTHTISLRENSFPSLKHFHKIGLFLPHIRALDLSGNPGISDIGGMQGGLEVISCHPFGRRNEAGGGDNVKSGLCHLKELVLTGCKIREDPEKAEKLDIYLRDILARFPNLMMLDGQPIPRITFPVESDIPPTPITKQQMDEIKQKDGGGFSWPCDVKGKWADTPALEQFGGSFLAKFFSLMDTDRLQLLVAYSPNVTLSHNITTVVPPRARAAGYFHALPNQKSLNFDQLRKHSRNLQSLGPQRWARSLLVASDEGKLRDWLLQTLPKSRHPVTEAEKWMYDVVGLDAVNGVGRVMLIAHGEFAELPTEGLRSFTRTLIIAESTPGSPAATAGWPGVILADTLSIRQYCGYSDFTKSLVAGGATVPVDAQPVVAAPAQQIPPDIAAIPDLNPAQMLVIAQVQAETNLVTPMALDLVKSVNYELGAAAVKFGELKAQIPPEYFRA